MKKKQQGGNIIHLFIKQNPLSHKPGTIYITDLKKTLEYRCDKILNYR